MNKDNEMLIRAYLEVYKEFEDIYRSSPVAGNQGGVIRVYRRSEDVMPLEIAKLFEIALNDSFLGRVLRGEISEKFQELSASAHEGVNEE